ncbi:Alpha-(1-_3)-arabinofuranosyltransferase [Corynebacterium kalinowskii]|uniref:Alpha-(1->3)-arabinofuranosyltransferase n=1 Tax=Corynebacterium kalinowskii TaxID=2675216 RepID=A0A6B8VDJ8_9CORY|nr:alpha-(1->3)-arabinofuranosyltransferase family protein [Corynebacterium kalinowskii]QGU01139.1 Alpha-(1->3)-arabinofuranosyltransferase [Corynebacterium kalinowskii]
MARASKHILGWLLLGIISFLQTPGRTVADTKHDLVANPGGFLSGALHAWTDIFPLGQLQNQAYGYLFPQGLFFLLTDPLPDWVAQRLWWWLVLGVGFSGFLLLVQRLRIGQPWWQFLGALLYALSPRTISTLGAISSETWPIMLVPWVLLPLVGHRPRARDVAASVLAVACIGAVNATATAAACVPAFLALLLARAWRPLGLWLLGCATVSLWWLGPLLILGKYSPPFTDFIESAYVTTRWLSLVEILRGASSWAPFADSERLAGTLLATSPYFVILTVAVAVIGLAGLIDAPHRRLWLTMVCVGALIMGAAHGPVSEAYLSFLDGAGAPLRNVHKFDALVHLPVIVGFVHLSSTIRLQDRGRRLAAAALLTLVAVGSMAPAWTGRLAPRGSYEQVPDYWMAAADWLNENASGTRTVILPQSSFARQHWGWTRDEPLQPLLDVPWVVRDAVPLVPPEAIRGLDGLMAEPSAEGFARLGVGVAVVRHDLAGLTNSHALVQSFEDEGFPVHSFGEVDIVEFDRALNMQVAPAETVRVAGGGESLALLDPSAYELVSEKAEIVTDTPQLVSRNYGSVWNAQSAPLASPDEGSDVRNKVRDYPSVGPLSRIREGSAAVEVSSSGADATAFGGADPARAATAAVDGSADTAWYPAPGQQEGATFTIRGEFVDPVVEVLTEGSPVVLTFSSGDMRVNKVVHPGQRMRVELPLQHATDIRITLGASAEPVGLADVSAPGHDLRRVLEVPDTSPNVQKFLFQRAFVDTGWIHRVFTAPREMSVRIDAASCDEEPATANPTGVTDDFLLDGSPVSCGQSITLSPGQHELSTTARWITLTTPDFSLPPAPTPIAGSVPVSAAPQLLITGRAFNEGLRATVGGATVEPRLIDAATQAYLIPPGVHGQVELSFVGDKAYRLSLFGGLALAAATALLCLVVLRRSPRRDEPLELGGAPTALGLITLLIVGGWVGAVAVALAWAIVGFTLISDRLLAALGMGLAGLWLAHAPWPSAGYAGDQWFVTLACCVSLAALLMPAQLRRTVTEAV